MATKTSPPPQIALISPGAVFHLFVTHAAHHTRPTTDNLRLCVVVDGLLIKKSDVRHCQVNK